MKSTKRNFMTVLYLGAFVQLGKVSMIQSVWISKFTFIRKKTWHYSVCLNDNLFIEFQKKKI